MGYRTDSHCDKFETGLSAHDPVVVRDRNKNIWLISKIGRDRKKKCSPHG